MTAGCNFNNWFLLTLFCSWPKCWIKVNCMIDIPIRFCPLTVHFTVFRNRESCVLSLLLQPDRPRLSCHVSGFVNQELANVYVVLTVFQFCHYLIKKTIKTHESWYRARDSCIVVQAGTCLSWHHEIMCSWKQGIPKSSLATYSWEFLYLVPANSVNSLIHIQSN